MTLKGPFIMFHISPNLTIQKNYIDINGHHARYVISLHLSKDEARNLLSFLNIEIKEKSYMDIEYQAQTAAQAPLPIGSNPTNPPPLPGTYPGTVNPPPGIEAIWISKETLNAYNAKRADIVASIAKSQQSIDNLNKEIALIKEKLNTL